MTTPTTPAELKALIEKATPGEWVVWTGCSWRRVGVRGAGPPIIYPTIASDGHPDLVGEEDLRVLVALRNKADALCDLWAAAEHHVCRQRSEDCGICATLRRLSREDDNADG